MPGEEKQQGYAFGTAITTPRLILRPATEEDRALMAALAANPHVAENLSADPSAMPGESGETFAAFADRAAHGFDDVDVLHAFALQHSD